MRIGVFHWAFYPMVGGVETYIESVYTNLAKRDVDVILLTGSVKDTPSKEVYKGLEIHRVDLLNLYSNYLKEKKPYELALETKDLIEKFILEENIDLLHFQNSHLTLFPPHIFGIILSMRDKKIPYVLTVHDIYNNNLCLHTITDLPWDKIITISNQRKKWLMRLGIEEDKIGLVYNGVDTSVFDPNIDPSNIREELNIPSDAKLITVPSRIIRRKSIETFIEAISIVNEKIPTYGIITGDGSLVNKEASAYKKELDSLVEKLNLEEKILFAYNQLSSKNIKRLYVSSDIITLTSLDEGFGLGILEGMALKRPVVCTKAGGLPEVVGDDGGIIVPTKNPKKLAQAYLRVLSNKNYAKDLAERGYKRALSKFSIKNVSDHNYDIYKEILKK